MARAYVNNKGAEDEKRRPPRPGSMAESMPRPSGGMGTPMPKPEGGQGNAPMPRMEETIGMMQDRMQNMPRPAQIQPPTMPMPFNPGEVERNRDETLKRTSQGSNDQSFQPFSEPTPMQMPNMVPQSQAMPMPMPQNRGMASAPMPQANPNQVESFLAQLLGGAAGAMSGQQQPVMGDPGLEAYMRALQQRM